MLKESNTSRLTMSRLTASTVFQLMTVGSALGLLPLFLLLAALGAAGAVEVSWNGAPVSGFGAVAAVGFIYVVFLVAVVAIGTCIMITGLKIYSLFRLITIDYFPAAARREMNPVDPGQLQPAQGIRHTDQASN